MSGFRLRRLAWSTWSEFGGRMGFDARFAAESLHGERREASPGARPASVKRRQRPERSLKVLASRFGHGSRQCGMSPARSMGLVLSVCSGSLALGATKQRGLGYTNSGVPWFDREETA
jgi:hypothetical protein